MANNILKSKTNIGPNFKKSSALFVGLAQVFKKQCCLTILLLIRYLDASNTCLMPQV